MNKMEIILLGIVVTFALLIGSGLGSGYIYGRIESPELNINNTAYNVTADYFIGNVTMYDTGDFIDYDTENDRYLFYIGDVVVGFVNATGFYSGSP